MGEVADEVARYSYKPGWRLVVDEMTGGGYALNAIADLPCSRVPGRIATRGGAVTFTEADVQAKGVESTVSEAIEALTRRQELHERDEWLRRDGVCLNDPHKENTMGTKTDHVHSEWTCDPMYDDEGRLTNPYIDGKCPRPEDFDKKPADG